MTSSEIRQSFLDFFREKGHTIVPSASLMPGSPNLLFTNAGMNQFVPIFLGEAAADVNKWQGAIPGSATRACDTQKCIRAGGKHNDLDDVGLDTYHHTFFEMLGNWSFGDYFKTEAIDWAWELVVKRWKFPPQRLYATVYNPDKTKGDPADFDFEAYDCWAKHFESVGLDPKVHIVNGNKKDNFWMMGETGPCGPCSELHVDLTPAGDTRGKLVNMGSAECIEIWNLVFIQFNANPDGSFSALPAKHVDTGMGFERVASIIQGTKHFTDFAHAKISNYETDIFRPIFDELEKMSGKPYGCTLPVSGSTGDTEEEKIDVAFRVIADHIRTLSFAIADGIQPGNTDRNYVLRRILRRAVKYGRTLGFQKPFFYQLVDVLARTMGDVFPEIRAKQKHVEEVLKREEEAFNRTLDKGMVLFEREAVRLQGSARVSRAGDGVPPSRTPGTHYFKRRLPHFELPWAIYAVTLSTHERRVLSPAARAVVLDSFLHFHGQRYDLLAICVMPDHAHLLLRPLPKEHDAKGEPVFWELSEIMHSVKSFTAHEINKLENTEGAVWEKERFDRYVRSDRDLEEKFQYILRNPWDAGLVNEMEDYEWVWTPEDAAQEESSLRRDAAISTRDACATRSGDAAVISGAFAFRLYDEQGFPLDLTELLARERGMRVDTVGFETFMKIQRQQSQAAQKREIISVSNIDAAPTQFIGYDTLSTPATVLDVVEVKGKTAVILDVSTCYAEMGGQVGDTGEIESGGSLWTIVTTQKTGATWLHFLAESDAPAVGASVMLSVDTARRAAIARHHTVTHLLHLALHAVVSPEATQKGSFVGPDKLTFDFNSAALTPEQVRDIERLVNEKIVENAPVSWTEVPYADVRANAGIMQFFGDKYSDIVRVVQIGGERNALNGYSMELCGGTHVRATGEIGLFRIVSEAAIAAGVRRIEAVAGLEAYDQARAASDRILGLAGKLNAPLGELEKKLDALLAEQKELQKQLKAVQQRQAADTACSLLAKAETLGSTPAIIANLGAVDGDTLQAVADALKGKFAGIIVLAGVAEGNVALAASVSPEFVKAFQAGKIIQALAPIVGGKGGGRPDFARGAGKDASQLDAALAQARTLLGS